MPGSNRDGTNQAEAPLRAAKKFTKFVDYHMSSSADTKGGFLSTEDDPHNPALGRGKPEGEERPKHMSAKEWERFQTLKRLQRNKAGPFEPGLSVLDDAKERTKCRECGSVEIDWVWEEVFGVGVCHACKEKVPDKYSLLTKTECKEDYLLTDCELIFLIRFLEFNPGTDNLPLQPSSVTPNSSRICPNPIRTRPTGTT
jgi:DNA-repair protein complementing XP-A cells